MSRQCWPFISELLLLLPQEHLTTNDVVAEYSNIYVEFKLVAVPDLIT